MSLVPYRKKRDFKRSPEPPDAPSPKRAGWRFVVQKHAASRLHYDFRLELDGVLKSWAVPKGPSLDPSQKRLAVEVEDHPVPYATFEGRIPKGEYGAGEVVIWDRGTWKPLDDPRRALAAGQLKFELRGEKLAGRWVLVRMGGRAGKAGKNWLLIKERDDEARAGKAADIVAARPGSVAGRRATGKRAETPARQTAATTGRRASLPERVAPQLATLVREAPEGEEWLHEIKYDGYRVIARLSRGKVKLFTRTGRDWTDHFGPVAKALSELPVRDAVLDGEVAVLQPDGTTSFQALQNALRDKATGRLVYFAFDLLHLDGRDLTKLPLEERKRRLEGVLGKPGRGKAVVRYSDHVVGQGPAFHEQACQRHLEGIVSKRRDGEYRHARTRDWVKVKCSARQEAVIGGYTDPQGARAGLGALLLGVYDGPRKRLRYAGRVGTGFTEAVLGRLRRQLGKLAAASPPFADPPRGGRNVHWVRPELVAEIAFTGWTDAGLMRHPSFQGLRADKAAREVVTEQEKPLPASRARKPAADGASTIAGVTITHPDKLLYPQDRVTKLDVARYMAQVAGHMLPEVAARPLMIVRCPDGFEGSCFFQKHPGATAHKAIDRVPVRTSEGPAQSFAIHDAAGLVALVQSGALEVHVWGARAERVEQPDRMVFDLDPDPSVGWPYVAELAHRVRELLHEFGLESFVKTTGGKGLHVVVPLRRGPAWEDVKAFSAGIAARLLRDDPDRLTTNMSKARRKGRVFLDTLRNRRGATWVAPYSPRARAGATVSLPVGWSEVTSRLDPARFTVGTVPAILARRRKDPWEGLVSQGQALTAAMLRTVAGPRRVVRKRA